MTNKIILIVGFFMFMFFSCKSKETVKIKKITKSLKDRKISKQDTTTEKITLLFIGDIMQHQAQIDNALNPNTLKYEFSEQFNHIKPIIDSADVSIANLEVTLSGEPYLGYPKFSSPDALLTAIKNAGINHLVTANNHIYDFGKDGFIRTLNTIDKYGLKRTGVFLNENDKNKNHPMVIDTNGFKIALFNYTYGTNNDTIENGHIYIDTASIKKDIETAEKQNYDQLIVFFHWGEEYERLPSEKQKQLANFCFKNGVDIIIGSHPHVIQPMKKFKRNRKDVFIAYSIGNYVSNYDTWRYCDGGAIVELTLVKDLKNNVHINKAGYYLVWVYKPVINKRRIYKVIPVSVYDNKDVLKGDFKFYFNRFKNDSRTHLQKYNKNVSELLLN